MSGELEAANDTSKMEDRILGLLIKATFKVHLLIVLIVGLIFFALSVFTAQALVHAAMEEVKGIIEANRCVCSQHPIRAEASGNRVTFMPDQNSRGQLIRDVLRKQDKIDDVSGVAGPINTGDR